MYKLLDRLLIILLLLGILLIFLVLNVLGLKDVHLKAGDAFLGLLNESTTTLNSKEINFFIFMSTEEGNLQLTVSV
jgi:Na+/H+ antiporter NhaC